MNGLAIPSHTDCPIQTPVPATETNACRNYTQNYQYDELGNILQIQHIASSGNWTQDYFYPADSNRLIGHTSGQTDYTYDVAGNMLSMPHLNSLAWNENNMPIEVDLGGGGTAYYRYDSQGQRVRKVVVNVNVKKERLYIGDWELWQQSTSGTVQTERETLNISDDKTRFLQLETLTITNGKPISATTNWRYQYDNHLGSACLELDKNAAVISYEEYFPFGSTSYRSGNSQREVKLKRYRYCGKEKDSESGLYYYGARYYAPWTCRFINVDPIAEKFPQLTPYNYAGNKPITHKDLEGLQGTGDNEVRTEDKTKTFGPFAASEEYKKGEKAANKTTENIDVNQIYPDGNLPQAGDKPTNLRHLIGTDFYYEARAIDFELRNPGETAPEYYREYGHKYLHEFKYETKDNLSPKGQMWLGDALENLQNAMEDIVQTNEGIESNAEELTDLAFKSHVDAYVSAGILGLSVMDKVKITLTVEPNDLLSARGLEQAKQVAGAQLEMYQNNPRFAVQQAVEAAWGYYSGAIGEEVRKYAEENTGYYIPPTIWKLMLPF